MTLRSVEQLSENELRGKRVLLRAGFDVPVEGGLVKNDFRLRETLPTIEYLRARGAKIIIISHIGRDKEHTLAPVAEALSKYVETLWAGGLLGDAVRTQIEALQDGGVLMLENLRSHDGETENDETFARELSAFADIYVNDAFSVAHRAHASIVGIPNIIPGYAGLSFVREVGELEKAFKPVSVSLFILGGAKFDTKLALIDKFLPLYDKIFVGGALAHDIWKAKGVAIGTSLRSDVSVDLSSILSNPKITLPVDVVVRNGEGVVRTTETGDVRDDEKIIDCGRETIAELGKLLNDAKTVLWNGTLGLYEDGGAQGSLELARAISASSAHSIIGGGDTVSAIESLGLHDTFGFVSTGGGAMLEFLEKGTLPGILVLTN